MHVTNESRGEVAIGHHGLLVNSVVISSLRRLEW